MLCLKLDRWRMRRVACPPVDLVVVPGPRGGQLAVGALQLLLEGHVLGVEHLELPLNLKFTPLCNHGSHSG